LFTAVKKLTFSSITVLQNHMSKTQKSRKKIYRDASIMDVVDFYVPILFGLVRIWTQLCSKKQV